VRAPDGLALSSRNGYLTEAERAEAPRLYRVISGLAAEARSGARNFADLEARAMNILRVNGWLPDYVAFRKKLDLQSPSAHDSGLVVLAAARLGSTRLIDNLEV
jgi:pantoate--beta-alanine ligase